MPQPMKPQPSKAKAPKEKHPKTTILRGRCYLCIGPNCWGKAFSPEDAERNAKKNFWTSSSRGWKFLMFDAPPDVYVDDMGNTVYQPRLYAKDVYHADDNDSPLENASIGGKPKEIYRWGVK